MAASRSGAAIRPSTGPKHSVWWKAEPDATPALMPGVQQRPSSSSRRGSRSQCSPGARVVRASASFPVAGPISGPKVVAGSVAGPTTSEAAASTTCRRNRSSLATLSTRIPRLAAEHFWPWWQKADRTRSAAARSRSALGVTTRAFLPLVSAKSRRSGLHERNRSAVSTPPVRMTPSAVVTRRRFTSASAVWTKRSRSVGTPAAQQASATISAHRRVRDAGLKTTPLPAARAATTPPHGMATGKFHGGTTATTPSGVNSAAATRSSSRQRSAYQRAKSTASLTSGSASGRVLPASCAMVTSRSSWRAMSSSATRRRTWRRSDADRADQATCAARTPATVASISATEVVADVAVGVGRRSDSDANHLRVEAIEGSVSGWLAKPISGTSTSSAPRRGAVPTAQRMVTDSRKRSACSANSGVPGRSVKRWWRKFSGAAFSSRRRNR